MKKGIIGTLSAMGGAVAGVMAMGKRMESKVEKECQMANKHLALFLMMSQ